MKTNVQIHDLAYITLPASIDARGHFVKVLRRATGDQGVDGAACHFTDVDAACAVWVVRGHQVPWGDGLVNVFSVSDSCLRPIRNRQSDDDKQIAQHDVNFLLAS